MDRLSIVYQNDRQILKRDEIFEAKLYFDCVQRWTPSSTNTLYKVVGKFRHCEPLYACRLDKESTSFATFATFYLKRKDYALSILANIPI